MDTKKIKDSIILFIQNTFSAEEYKHLRVNCEILDACDGNEQLLIESNASKNIPHSLSVDEAIRNYVYSSGFKNAIGVCKLPRKIIKLSFSEEKKQEENGRINDSSSFLVSTPKHKLKDVFLPPSSRAQVERAVAMVKNFDKIYKIWGFEEVEPQAKTILCFYGVPGTGKTKCAHGIAEALGKNIIVASYAEIQSKYVGEGPKNLERIFKKAESNDAVLFFDEADSFLRKRMSNSSDSSSMHYNSMTNEMMKHLEDCNGVVIFATNLTENIDEAFKTRIAAAVEFVVPDRDARKKIIEYHIPLKVPFKQKLTDNDLYMLADTCEGFVGRDIRNAVKLVLCEGAASGIEAFELSNFITGFNEYKENKAQLQKDITKNERCSIKSIIEKNG